MGDSKIINLIKESILENSNLKNVPKVLVLQHCRGMNQVDIKSSSESSSDSESDIELDGAVNDHIHRMNDTAIFWSTSEGNPAIRTKNGSVYLQYFFKCLDRLNSNTHDIYDLQRWLNQCL